MEPAPQFSMLGEFRVEAVLGQGGSGIVYDATWGPRRVALKVLHPSLVGTPKDRSQFLAEAQRLQQITHPSVVKVLAVGQLPDGRPYLAMERLDGETLASVVMRGPLPLTSALEMFGELCAAVAALHEQQLIHRDLKPENVFVVAQKHAVLLDFGIAKDLAAPASTITQEGNVRGTPAYMAPERFFGQPAGIATDVYELAVTLYVMLAGRLPWDDVADPETRLSPRSLRDHAPDVPEALDIEVRRALSTRVQNRPSSAAALLDAVRAAAAVDPETEQSASSTARLRTGAHEALPAASPPLPSTTATSATKPAPERTASAEHQTPLAWAPTVAAPVSSAPSSRRARWPLAIGLGAVAIAGAVFAWWRLRDDETAAPQAVVAQPAVGSGSAKNDPWGEGGTIEGVTTPVITPSTESKSFALVSDKLSPEQYRREAAAAIGTLPADTRVIIGVQLVDLRANAQTNAMLEALPKNPKVAPLAALLPACVRGLLAEADWFVFGSPNLNDSTVGTIILRGRWRRADAEACLADSVRTHKARDGATLYGIGDKGWLDFLDEHTVYVTLNTKLDADAIHKAATKPVGPLPRTRQLLARLPAARSITFVADGKARADWSMLALPSDTDVFGWLLLDTEGATLDFAADPHTEEAARVALDQVKPELESVFGGANEAAVGKLEATRTGSVVRVKGSMTAFVLGLVTSALEP